MGLSAVFAILAYCKAVQTIGPSDTAILSTFEPVTGVVLGMIVFGEKISLIAAIRSFLIIISVLLFAYSRNVRAQKSKIPDEA